MKSFIFYFTVVFALFYLIIVEMRIWNTRLQLEGNFKKYSSPLWIHRLTYNTLFLFITGLFLWFSYWLASHWSYLQGSLNGWLVLGYVIVFIALAFVASYWANQLGICLCDLRKEAVKKSLPRMIEYHGAYSLGDIRLSNLIDDLNGRQKIPWVVVSVYYKTETNLTLSQVVVYT